MTFIIADKHLNVLHSMDVWHKAKLLRKVLINVRYHIYVILAYNFIYLCTISYKAGKLRGMEKIALWSQNIVNHFWYCSRTCNGDLTSMKVCMHAYE